MSRRVLRPALARDAARRGPRSPAPPSRRAAAGRTLPGPQRPARRGRRRATPARTLAARGRRARRLDAPARARHLLPRRGLAATATSSSSTACAWRSARATAATRPRTSTRRRPSASRAARSSTRTATCTATSRGPALPARVDRLAATPTPRVRWAWNFEHALSRRRPDRPLPHHRPARAGIGAASRPTRATFFLAPDRRTAPISRRAATDCPRSTHEHLGRGRPLRRALRRAPPRLAPDPPARRPRRHYAEARRHLRLRPRRCGRCGARRPPGSTGSTCPATACPATTAAARVPFGAETDGEPRRRDPVRPRVRKSIAADREPAARLHRPRAPPERLRLAPARRARGAGAAERQRGGYPVEPGPQLRPGRPLGGERPLGRAPGGRDRGLARERRSRSRDRHALDRLADPAAALLRDPARRAAPLLDVGILVHRFSGDAAGYPDWPSSEPANVFDPVAAVFYYVPGRGSGWRRESYDVRSLPPSPMSSASSPRRTTCSKRPLSDPQNVYRSRRKKSRRGRAIGESRSRRRCRR